MPTTMGWLKSLSWWLINKISFHWHISGSLCIFFKFCTLQVKPGASHSKELPCYDLKSGEQTKWNHNPDDIDMSDELMGQHAAELLVELPHTAITATKLCLCDETVIFGMIVQCTMVSEFIEKVFILLIWVGQSCWTVKRHQTPSDFSKSTGAIRMIFVLKIEKYVGHRIAPFWEKYQMEHWKKCSSLGALFGSPVSLYRHEASTVSVDLRKTTGLIEFIFAEDVGVDHRSVLFKSAAIGRPKWLSRRSSWKQFP